MFLGEIRLRLKISDSLHELGYRHLASKILKILGNHLFLSLAEDHKEVELGEGDEAISINISDVHDFFDLRFVLFEVLFVVLWLLEVVWSQSTEEVLICHLGLAFFI